MSHCFPQNKTECWSIEATVAAVNGVFVSSTVDLYDFECQNEIVKTEKSPHYWFAIELTTKISRFGQVVFFFRKLTSNMAALKTSFFISIL